MRPVVDTSGKWQGGYKPIAVRCSPFQANEIGDDPLGDILIESSSDRLAQGAGISLIDEGGGPSVLIQEIHRLFRLLQDSRWKFAEALDLMLVGNYLVPLCDANGTSMEGDDPPLYIVDAGRFLQADKKALGALVRHNFTALDVSVACLLSQRLLREDFRQRSTNAMVDPAEKATRLAKESFNTVEFDVVLDDSELISLGDIGVLSVCPGTY